MPIQKYFGQIGVASGPNYPGYFTNGTFSSTLTANGIVNTGPVSGNLDTINPATVATLALTASQSGNTFLLSSANSSVATAEVIILPTPTPGLTFNFDVITAATASYTYKITSANASVYFQGIDAKFVAGTIAGANVFQSTGTSSYYYDMNGTTTGGLVGTNIKATCLTANLWQIQALSIGSGTLLTSFATS